jgi:DNA-binding transcriptional ArsR family regulator
MKDFLPVAKAMADENRARILLFLRDDELCVCQVIEMLRLAPSTVSKHLSILHRAGLIKARKDGRWSYYRLSRHSPSPTVRETIHWAQKCLDGTPIVLEDAERLKSVRRMDIKQLCERYHDR